MLATFRVCGLQAIENLGVRAAAGKKFYLYLADEKMHESQFNETEIIEIQISFVTKKYIFYFLTTNLFACNLLFVINC